MVVDPAIEAVFAASSSNDMVQGQFRYLCIMSLIDAIVCKPFRRRRSGGGPRHDDEHVRMMMICLSNFRTLWWSEVAMAGRIPRAGI